MHENEIKLMLAHCAQLWPQIEKPFMALMVTLTPRESMIIQSFFGIGCASYTHKELATRFKISMERVEQIRERAFRKIGHPGRAEAVAQLLSACALPIAKVDS